MASIVALAVTISLSGFFGMTRAQVDGNVSVPCPGQSVGCPTGLVSYGYDNSTGETFSTKSNVSIGYVSFTSLQANNSLTPHGWAINDPTLSNASTLQLNNMLVVNNSNGSQFTYWSQNVLLFGNNSGTPTIILADNIFNMSSLGALDSAPSISSQNGTVTDSSGEYYYGNYLEAPYFTIEKPFSAEQITEVRTEPSHGAMVYNFLYVMQNGSSSPYRLLQFDAAKINDQQISNSYLYVADSLNPARLLYDSEYVFGGPGGGASSTFSKMDATIGLFYANTTSSSGTPFQSYYSYGSDTAESASNLLVDYLGAGLALVTIGSPYYGPLTSTFSSTSSTTALSPTISSATSAVFNTTTTYNSTTTAAITETTSSSQEKLVRSSSSTLSSTALHSSITTTTASSSSPSSDAPNSPRVNSGLSSVEIAAIGFAVVLSAVGGIGLSRRRT